MEAQSISQDVINYYEALPRPVKEIVVRGMAKGLSQGQIENGMVKVYDRIHNGEEIRPIRIVWEVWDEAKRSEAAEYVVDQSKIAAMLERNKQLRADLDECDRKWLKMIILLSLIEIGAVIYWYSVF